jgi:Domain of unknown function (DUF6484)
MGGRELLDHQDELPAAEAALSSPTALQPEGADALAPLLAQPSAATHTDALPSVVVGELIALSDEGRTALVTYPGQPNTAAQRARSVIDLHALHIGQPVVLMFEAGDPTRPIVVGVLRQREGWPESEVPSQVQVEADGERLIVSAAEQLVLRCGKASITLTKAGKVLIQGSYLSSRSSGVNRIKGGSVQLN